METTATTELVETGEKRDVRGRKLVTDERRAELLAEYRRSGMTQTAFALREGIKYSTFCTWWAQAERAAGRRPVRPSGGARAKPVTGKKPAIKFVEACLPAVGAPFAGAAAAGLAVRLPDGTELRGGSAGELAALVRALRD